MTYVSPTEVLPKFDTPFEDVEWLKPGSTVYIYEAGSWGVPGRIFETTVTRVTKTRVTTEGQESVRRSWYSPSFGRTVEEYGSRNFSRGRYLVPPDSPLIASTRRDIHRRDVMNAALRAVKTLADHHPEHSDTWSPENVRAAAAQLNTYADQREAWTMEDEEEAR